MGWEDKFTLDLHGVRHKDVFRKVDTFIGAHLMDNSRTLFIITGRSPEMKKIVNKILVDYNMEAKDTFTNPGVVTVDLY
jgi:DNA-nicking Smr family endonuclease